MQLAGTTTSYPALDVATGGMSVNDTTIQSLVARETNGPNTWYVTTGGDDGNAGTSWAAPLETVTQAITNASNGDTIRLGPGEWEAEHDFTSLSGINLIGCGPGITVLDQTTLTSQAVKPCSYLRCFNLSITHTGSPTEGSQVICMFGAGSYDGIEFHNCRVESTGTAIMLNGRDFIFNETHVTGSEYGALLGVPSYDNSQRLMTAVRSRFAATDWDICLTRGLQLNAGHSTLENCDVYAECRGTDGQESRALYADHAARVVMRGGTIYSDNANGDDGSNKAYGIDVRAGSSAILDSVDIQSACTITANAYDIYISDDATSRIELTNCRYDSDKVLNSAGGTVLDRSLSIQNKTDGLNFTGDDVQATLDGEEVTTDAASRAASKADVSALATTAALAALESHGDSTWATATGFSTHTAADVKTALEANGSKLDHLWETTEDDGEGTRKFTSDALSDVSVDTSGLATSVEITALQSHGDSEWATGEGGVAGSGAVSTTVVCQVGGSPVDGVEVWVTTDAAGTNVVAGTITTDSSGEVDFMLDAGDYYVWRKKAGINFSNPQDLTVS